MANNFIDYSEFYDLLNRDKDYLKETKYIDDCIQNHSPGSRKILEYGSGTGKHGILLKQMGYDILGLERSLEMVNLAKLNNYPCKVASIEDYVIDQKFDVVIALFHVISYINDNKSIINVFNNANRDLKKGGLFIFDVWYSPAVFKLRPENRIRRITSKDIEIIRVAEPEIFNEKNVVNVNYSILINDKNKNNSFMINETHPMRHFSFPEIELFSSICNFEIIKAEEFGTKNIISENTWGVTFVLKKNN